MNAEHTDGEVNTSLYHHTDEVLLTRPHIDEFMSQEIRAVFKFSIRELSRVVIHSQVIGHLFRFCNEVVEICLRIVKRHILTLGEFDNRLPILFRHKSALGSFLVDIFWQSVQDILHSRNDRLHTTQRIDVAIVRHVNAHRASLLVEKHYDAQFVEYFLLRLQSLDIHCLTDLVDMILACVVFEDERALQEVALER